MAVTAPTVTPLPDPPLPTYAPAVFDAKAGASLAAQQVMVPQINTSLSWMADQVNSTEGYKNAAETSASNAAASATSADQSRTAAQAAAAAAGSSAGLPSLAGNARRPLAVLANESGVSWLTQVKALFIEPLLKTNVSGSYALAVGTSGFFNLTLTGNTTLSFSGLPTLSATEALVLVVRVNQGSTAYSLTFPASIVWVSSGGIAPSAPAANKTVEYLITFEGSQIFGRKGSGT